MIIGIDVGNTHMRAADLESNSEDIFFKGTSNLRTLVEFRRSLKEVNPQIRGVVISSVVPNLKAKLIEIFSEFGILNPHFVSSDSPLGISIGYDRPTEIGSDRLMTAEGARHLFPDTAMLLIDLGTASTLGAITSDGRFLGGVIFAGLQTGVWALSQKTEQLDELEITATPANLGKSTAEAINAGAFYQHLYAIRGFIQAYQKEHFGGHKPFIVGTGGMSSIFAGQDVFDVINEKLIFKGLRQIAKRLGYYEEL